MADPFPRERSFDDHWKFHHGDVSGGEQPQLDDSSWRPVDVPHDWSIEMPFDPKSPAGFKGGWATGGVGWYRKHFKLDIDPGQRAELRFDGVYRYSEVWLNGTLIGGRPSGYIPFTVDLTPHLRTDGGENVLALRCRNEGESSRWYSGSGIYRHVWLVVTGRLRIAEDGVFITTPQVSADAAEVHVQVEVQSAAGTSANPEVHVEIHDPSGLPVAAVESFIPVPAGSSGAGTLRLKVPSPKRWSPDTPHLYTAHVVVFAAGKPLDEVRIPFGIRTIEIDAKHGLRLNGEKIILRGGCVHHDNGILGAKAIDRAEVRKIELLKAAGYNAIRTAHNPPSPAFLDACDRLGMIVMDELFDEWETTKVPDGIGKVFKEWQDRDVETVIRRDRNHPCVLMWSIGNEIFDCFTRPDIAQHLREEVLKHDSTRPITAGVCKPFWKEPTWVDWQTSSDPAYVHLDIAGYNYLLKEFLQDHERHPDRVMVATESFPRDVYDVWQAIAKHPFVIGEFVWTAIDYLGESSIGQTFVDVDGVVGFTFPFHTAVCGDIDLIGRRKPQSYYREANWRRGVLHTTVHAPLLPGQREQKEGWSIQWGWDIVRSHWTWPGNEGKTLKVEVYSSCDRVRLFLNGRDLGEKPTGVEEKFRATFEVPYEPGELKAVGTVDGKTAEHILRTAGEPAAIQLRCNRTSVSASRDDLAFVDVVIVDSQGNEVHTAGQSVRATVAGPGRLVALGNANPVDVDSLCDNEHRAWNGRLLAVIQPTGEPGEVQLTVESQEGAKATLAIQIRPQ